MAIQNKRIYLSVLSGIFLEYFDYTLYGFAISYIAQSFFPTENQAVSLMLSWTIFSISFLVRPLGAVIFGHFADRVGRRVVLIFTIFFMSIGTICMGLIPGYTQIGIMAPILLLVCRVLQGLTVSTEYSGSSTYCLELYKKHHGLNSGILTGASGLGMFAASSLFLFYGSHWREIFVVAGLIVGVLALYFRLSIPESPEFLKMEKMQGIVAFPFVRLFKEFPKLTITGTLISMYTGILIIAIEVYLPNYLQTHFAIPKTLALQVSTYLILIEIFFAILWGYLSDFFGQVKIMALGGVLMLLLVFPIFALFESSSTLIWYIAATLLAILVGAVDGPIAAYLVHSFPTRVRYTGVSVCYNFGLGGGLSPMLLTLLQSDSSKPMMQIFLMISAIGVLLVFVLFKPQINPEKFFISEENPRLKIIAND